jgi:hypothetical protein
MIDTSAKSYLHNDFHNIRATMLWKLDGLAEYDIRRPMTPTGTNLLGLIKHLSNTEARYFGEVFGHPFPERPPRWDAEADADADMWTTEHETRADIIDQHHSTCRARSPRARAQSRQAVGDG